MLSDGAARLQSAFGCFAMEGCRMMLKKCSIGRLKEGMVLGQDVHRSDMTVLLGEGTTLTSKMIDALADHDIFSVQIQVEDEEEATPAKAASALEEPLRCRRSLRRLRRRRRSFRMTLMCCGTSRFLPR